MKKQTKEFWCRLAFAVLIAAVVVGVFVTCQATNGFNGYVPTLQECIDILGETEYEETINLPIYVDTLPETHAATTLPADALPSSQVIFPGGLFDLASISAFDGKQPYAIVNGNVPYFTEDEITVVSYETYMELDSLKRCGPCFACVGRDIMPTDERGSISSVKPTGWIQASYPDLGVSSLYNRCHLIGYQLTGENANKMNLITGTRYMNVDGMLPFEDMAADYVRETENHVMYRVTPVFVGGELVARGVLMEAYSVEDDGEGVTYCVFCYNVQPGVVIDYATGESWRQEEDAADSDFVA